MARLFKFLFVTLLVAAGAVAGLSYAIYSGQEDMIFQPTRELTGDPSTIGLRYEDLQLESSDGRKIHAWYIPAPGADSVVLFLHGNAGNMSHRLDVINGLIRMGQSVFMIDYQGYGNSEGEPSEQALYDDALVAWQHLAVDKEFSTSQIVIYGRSLGGAVASWLAASRPHGALIMESTFSSMVDLSRQHYPWLPVDWLLKVKFDSLERMPSILSPVLIVHSDSDSIVPVAHAQRLYDAANKPRYRINSDGGHNALFHERGSAFEEGLQAFFQSHIHPLGRLENNHHATP